MNTIDILIADDHTIFRSGLIRLLHDEPDIQIKAEARAAGEVLEQLRRTRVNLVLLDINMDGQSGFDVLDAIKAEFPSLPVLMLSMYPEEQYALVAIKRGANGYLSKDAEPADLVHAIRRTAANLQYLSPRAAALVQAQLEQADSRPLHHRLSTKEHQILLLLLRGMGLTEIGQEMNISVKTVSTHRTHILEKLGVANNAELVIYAIRAGLIH